MRSIPRVTPAHVRERNALLVCAYEDDVSFRLARLEGAISLAEFRKRNVPPDQEVVFYCG